MSNQEYIDTFDEVRDGYNTMGLDKVEVMRVGGVGKREVATILSCGGLQWHDDQGQCRCH